MKKLISILLIAAIAVLCGCGGTGEKVADLSSQPDVSPEAASEDKSDAPDVDVTLDEQVVYDANDIKVTVTGFEAGGIFGSEITVLVENNGQRNVIVEQDDMSINGYMVTGSLFSEVTAGNKANDSILIMNDDLESCGIGAVAEISLNLYVIDADTYERIDTAEPVTLQTSAYGSYTQEYDDSGDVVYDADGVKIVVKCIGDDSIFGPGIRMYMQNDTDRNIAVSGDTVSVNGFMLTGWLYTSMTPNTKAVDSLTLLQSDLDDNGIDKIETVEFTLSIVDTDTFETIASTGAISMNAE